MLSDRPDPVLRLSNFLADWASAIVEYEAERSHAQILEVRDLDGVEVFHAFVEGAGHHSVLIGFLEPRTSYSLYIGVLPFAKGPSGEVVHEFQTLDPPYLWATGSSLAFQPGTPILQGNCIGGFVLRDAMNATLYFLTASHCVEAIGENVTLRSGETLGTVAVKGAPQHDWVLVQIDATRRANVSAQVKYWTGPTSVTPAESLTRGHLICMGRSPSANGNSMDSMCGPIVESIGLTQDGRTATLLSVNLTAEPGQSGAPFIDPETGTGIGLLIGRSPSHDVAWAVSLHSVLELLHDQGLELKVSRAQFDPPSDT